jgi:hypothetical protein
MQPQMAQRGTDKKTSMKKAGDAQILLAQGFSRSFFICVPLCHLWLHLIPRRYADPPGSRPELSGIRDRATVWVQ